MSVPGLGSLGERVGMRLIRLVTRAAVARPGLWRLFRRPVQAEFDRLAPAWEGRRGPEYLVPLAAALERVPSPPGHVLDAGTGTGKAARLAARLFPEAEIEGFDLSPAMIAEARRLLPAELGERVRFSVADAAALPYEDGAYDLVILLNMIPFFGELARVTAPGGLLVMSFSWGAQTPIYVPPQTLRERLEPLGFELFDELEAGGGSAFLARRRNGSEAE